MKLLILVLAVSGTLAAPHFSPTSRLRAEPRSIGPFAEFRPFSGLGSLLFGSSEPIEEAVKVGETPAHELISLDEFPVWRLHHYSGIDLKPVGESELGKPISNDNYPIVQEENPLEVLSGLSTGLLALGGIRDALTSLRTTITHLPETMLGLFGFGGETTLVEETPQVEGLPVLPNLREVIQLPEAISALLPSLPTLPFRVPILTGDRQRPEIYVTFHRGLPKKEVPLKEVPLVYEVPKVPEVTYGVPKEPEITYGVPNKVEKVPVTSYEAPAPTYGLPATYDSSKYAQTSHGVKSAPPQGLVLPLNLPQGSIDEYHNLAVLSANALGQFNTVNEAVEAIQSLNELNSLGDLSGGGFEPSNGLQTKRVFKTRIDEATQLGGGHIAKSEPARLSPPDFKSSQPDPVIVLPSNVKPATA